MINPLDCTGKTILVTGASSGIGREISILLSELGAKIVLVGRDYGRLVITLERLSGEGHLIVSRDLMDVDSISLWLKQLSSEIGPMSGLVHSAGVQLVSPVRAISTQQFEETMRLNVTTAFSLTKGFRQKGVCTSPACIVFLSSTMGQVSRPGLAAYSASKGALSGLTKSLALELAKEKIRVNCIAPGWVKGEMTDKAFSTMTPDQITYVEKLHPLGLGEPRDVAYAAAFLLSDSGLKITGTTLVIDGGYTAQ